MYIGPPVSPHTTTSTQAGAGTWFSWRIVFEEIVEVGDGRGLVLVSSEDIE
jgi:hypothetical protein